MTAATSVASAALQSERTKRVMDAVALRQPDRVPVGFHTMLWLARYGGITIRELMYGYERCTELGRRVLEEFQPDLFAPPHQFATLGPVMEAAGFKQIEITVVAREEQTPHFQTILASGER